MTITDVASRLRSLIGLDRGLEIVSYFCSYYFEMSLSMFRQPLPVHLRTLIGVDRDLGLVNHFFRHYRQMGIRKFRVQLHSNDPSSPNFAIAEKMLKGFGVTETTRWTAPYVAAEHTLRLIAITEDLPPNAWIVTADIDEFHEYPKSLRTLIPEMEALDRNILNGRFLQRVTADLTLPGLHPRRPIFGQFPRVIDIEIGYQEKLMLHRNYMKIGAGAHSCVESPEPHKPYPELGKINHFKWFEGVFNKYTDPKLIAHHDWPEEYVQYREFISSNFRQE